MDENEKLRLLFEELLKQERIVKNFKELVPGHLTVKKEILDEMVRSPEYTHIGRKADMRSDSEGDWAKEYRTQIATEKSRLDNEIIDQKTSKKKEIDSPEMRRQAEIAEAKIKIIRAMIEGLAGKETWKKLGEFELEEVLTEHIEEKAGSDDPEELP